MKWKAQHKFALCFHFSNSRPQFLFLEETVHDLPFMVLRKSYVHKDFLGLRLLTPIRWWAFSLKLLILDHFTLLLSWARVRYFISKVIPERLRYFKSISTHPKEMCPRSLSYQDEPKADFYFNHIYSESHPKFTNVKWCRSLVSVVLFNFKVCRPSTKCMTGPAKF